eukprot:gene12270-5854_t
MKFVWNEVVEAPLEVSHHSVSYNQNDDCLYISGGYSQDFIVSQNLHVFNIKEHGFKRYNEKFELFGRCGHTSVIYDNYLIIFGGCFDSKFQRLCETDKLYFFDLNDFTTEEIVFKTNEIPDTRCFHSCILNYKNEMVIFGGRKDEKTSFNDLWIFSFENKKWKNINYKGFEMDCMHLHTSQSIDHYMYLFGGKSSTKGMQDRLYRFNFNTETFESINCHSKISPCSRFLLNSFTVDGLFYIIGGETYADVLSDIFVFNPLINQWNKQQSDLSEKDIRWTKCVKADGRIWMIGGVILHKSEPKIYASCKIMRSKYIYSLIKNEQVVDLKFNFRN